MPAGYVELLHTRCPHPWPNHDTAAQGPQHRNGACAYKCDTSHGLCLLIPAFCRDISSACCSWVSPWLFLCLPETQEVFPIYFLHWPPWLHDNLYRNTGNQEPLASKPIQFPRPLPFPSPHLQLSTNCVQAAFSHLQSTRPHWVIPASSTPPHQQWWLRDSR